MIHGEQWWFWWVGEKEKLCHHILVLSPNFQTEAYDTMWKYTWIWRVIHCILSFPIKHFQKSWVIASRYCHQRTGWSSPSSHAVSSFSVVFCLFRPRSRWNFIWYIYIYIWYIYLYMIHIYIYICIYIYIYIIYMGVNGFCQNCVAALKVPFGCIHPSEQPAIGETKIASICW